MRAIQIVELTGPDHALTLAEIPEPDASHPMTPGEGVVVEVHAAGASFPELLQTRGRYQIQPDLPFVPGSEVGGVVISAPERASVKPGDRVAAFTLLGGFAEVAVAPADFVFALPDEWSFRQGAALILNYHTAHFALTTRGRLRSGETVLVHGAAGGVGSAALQIANGLGARTIAIVSSDEKEHVARTAGADHVFRADGPWKDQTRELGGADIVVDPVGGERFIDSLRSLNEGGRLLVIGFTEGSIPELRVNRLLLGNLDVIGAGWGGYAIGKPEFIAETGAALAALTDAGYVNPIIGASFPLERAADALRLIEGRGATGKTVLDVRQQRRQRDRRT